MKKTRVIVTGACGRMGLECVRAISAEKDMELTGAFDVAGVGKDIGELAGIGTNGVIVSDSLVGVLKSAKPDVAVDFTIAEGFGARAAAILKSGTRLVSGTTGIDAATIKKLEKIAAEKKLCVLIAPNFAVGAALMTQFAQMAAERMSECEIIELHHNRKLDAPSGTAMDTAKKVADVYAKSGVRVDPTKTVKLDGARGGSLGGVSVHSVRLPGFLASQEVIFGAPGQTLSIRHDTISRESFMPGVILAVRSSARIKKLVVGLENVL
jgi:4-hydroxy-tetrahydrodipicolinate reductase